MLRSCERLTNLPALRKIGFQANRRLLRVQQLSHDPITGITALHNVTEPGLQSACSLISCDLVPHGRLVLQGAHSHRVPSRSCQPDPRSASARRSRAPTDRPTWASRFVGAVVTPTNHHRAPRIASPVTTAPAVIGTHDGVQHHRPRSGVTCLRWMCRSLDGSAAVAAGGSGLDAEVGPGCRPGLRARRCRRLGRAGLVGEFPRTGTRGGRRQLHRLVHWRGPPTSLSSPW